MENWQIPRLRKGKQDEKLSLDNLVVPERKVLKSGGGEHVQRTQKTSCKSSQWLKLEQSEQYDDSNEL